MDLLKLHVLLNYYPAIGVVLGTLLLAAGLLIGNEGAKRFSLKLFAVMAALTLLVALAGEAASWGINHYGPGQAAALTAHRHTATAAFLTTVLVGIASLFGLKRVGQDTARAKWIYMFALVLGIASSGLLIGAVLKGRHVKWAAAIPTEQQQNVLIFIETEKTPWHA